MTDRRDQSPAERELRAWLDERAAAFGQWAEETGDPGRWDFTPDSLETLEDLIRSRFTDERQVTAAKTGPFIQGAVWYIGEVLCRSTGASWEYEPWSPYSDTPPGMFASGEPMVTDTPYLAHPNMSEGEDGLYPMGAINMLYWTKDEFGNPVDGHLRDLLDEFD